MRNKQKKMIKKGGKNEGTTYQKSIQKNITKIQIGHLTCWSVLTFGSRADVHADVESCVLTCVMMQLRNIKEPSSLFILVLRSFGTLRVCFDCAGFVNFAFTRKV